MTKKVKWIVVSCLTAMGIICFSGCDFFAKKETPAEINYQEFYMIYLNKAQEAGDEVQEYDEWLGNLIGKADDETLSLYEQYLQDNPDYSGTEKEWIEAYVNDTLAKYTVTFLDYYGEMVSTQTISYGEAATAPDIPLEIENLYFLEWDKAFSWVKEDMTVNAVYAYKTYTVSYDTNGGNDISSEKVNFGSAPTQPSEPTKLGCSFVGWFIDSEYTTAYYFDYAFDVDTTLYAKMQQDYEIITTAEELNNISLNPDNKYMLANDIDYKAEIWTPIERFSGTLDGNGYTISNLVLNNTTSNYGFIKTNLGTVKNLVFDQFVYHYKYTNASDSTATAGIFVGRNDGAIENCELRTGDVDMKVHFSTSSGSWTGYLGGICGRNYGTVVNCFNYVDTLFEPYGKNSGISGTISLKVWYGDIVGFNENSIQGCFTMGTTMGIAYGASSGEYYAHANSAFVMGGIVGGNGQANDTATINECSSKRNVTVTYKGSSGNLSKAFLLGGIAGQNRCTIKDCLVLGSMAYTNEGNQTDTWIGGAVGENHEKGLVTNTYTDVDITVGGNLTRGNVGGLVGVSENTSNITRSVSASNITLAKAITGYGKLVGTHKGVEHICYYLDTVELKVDDMANEGTNTVGESVAVETLQTEDFIYNTLYWNSSIWTVTSGQAPTLKRFAQE